MQVRMLPFVIFSCLLLFCVKVADILEGSELFTNTFLIAGSSAQTPAHGGEEKKEGGKAEEGGHEAKPGEKKDEKADKKKDKKKEEPPAVRITDTPPEKVVTTLAPDPGFSDAEVEVLQRLRQRRDQLDVREQDLETREKVLKVAESRIDQKIEDLKGLKSEVEKLLSAYDEKEELKLKSLVKIYETMKPKDTARIFEKLDMATLLPVIDKMKEAKTAPVLAAMDPQKAKEITTALSKLRQLPETGDEQSSATP